MSKFTAVFHISESSKYDGTNTYANLVDLLDENGQHVPEDSSLWEECDDRTWIWTDNPAVHGVPDEKHEVFGHSLSYEEFRTGVYVKDDDDCEVEELRLEFEADLVETEEDGGTIWKIVSEVSIVTWFNSPHESDLKDVVGLLEQAKGQNFRLVEDRRLDPHGAAIVVWEGGSHPTDQQLADAVQAKRETQTTN